MRLELRPVLALVLIAAVAILTGCSGGEDTQARLAALEKNREQVRETLKENGQERRQMRKDLDDTRIVVDQHDKAISQIPEDLRNRIKEMVLQETRGRRGWVRPRPEVQPRFEVKPYMGFDAQDLLPDVAEHLKLKAKSGLLVTDVRPGSPAAVAGIAKNDVIQSFDGHEVKDFKDLKKAFAGKKPGDMIAITVLRGEKKIEFNVKLGAKKVRVG